MEKKRRAGRLDLDRVEEHIVSIRSRRSMLDADVAELYGVSVDHLTATVKRHAKHFPKDFVLRLTAAESRSLSERSNQRHGDRRSPRFAFTEHGVAMLASVLDSPRAVLVSLEIVRTFIGLRDLVSSYADLARKLQAHEATLPSRVTEVLGVVTRVGSPPPEPNTKRRIGFIHPDERS